MRGFFCFYVWLLSSMASGQGLIGGQVDLYNLFPEVIKIPGCTAVVVGPRVILTAAHCVRVKHPRITYWVKNVKYQADCEVHPDYKIYKNQPKSVDMGLCKSDKRMTVRTAWVASNGPKKGDQVVLTGYGCTSKYDRIDNKLRYGFAPVTRLAEQGYQWFTTHGKTAVCWGDSGGPAFNSTRFRRRQGQRQVIFGVNSQGNISNFSKLTAIYRPKARAWMKSWAVANRVRICGINGCDRLN